MEHIQSLNVATRVSQLAVSLQRVIHLEFMDLDTLIKRGGCKALPGKRIHTVVINSRPS